MGKWSEKARVHVLREQRQRVISFGESPYYALVRDEDWALVWPQSRLNGEETGTLNIP